MSYSVSNVPVSSADGSPGPGYPVLRWWFPHDAGATSVHLTFHAHDWTGGWYHVWVNSATLPGSTMTPTIYQQDCNPSVDCAFDLTLSPTTPPYFQVYTGGFGIPSWSGQLDITATFTGGTGAFYCAYGVQANPDASYYELITDSLIDLVVAAALIGTANAYLIPYVETALAAIEGSIFVAVDCSILPGAGPTLDFPRLSDLNPTTLQAWFQSAAWHFFCQCVPAPPGSPDPTPPDPPPIIPPTTVVAVQPAPVCDNTDLCSYLAAMKAQLQTITAQLSFLRTDVTLIQRQKVPFAYVPGIQHSGLTGAGQFAVRGILGLIVRYTTVPSYLARNDADPQTIYNIGRIAVGTTDGWQESHYAQHNPWQLLSIDGAVTLVGYTFASGVVADVVELVREP